jgi:hypothetical protein
MDTWSANTHIALSHFFQIWGLLGFTHGATELENISLLKFVCPQSNLGLKKYWQNPKQQLTDMENFLQNTKMNAENKNGNNLR